MGVSTSKRSRAGSEGDALAGFSSSDLLSLSGSSSNGFESWVTVRAKTSDKSSRGVVKGTWAFPASKEGVVLGRGNADGSATSTTSQGVCMIQDPSIAAEHARVSLTDDGTGVALVSTGRCYMLIGQGARFRLAPQTLAKGSVLKMGACSLQVTDLCLQQRERDTYKHTPGPGASSDNQCYICFDDTADEVGNPLEPSPCVCSKMVHRQCLSKWIATKGSRCCSICKSKLPIDVTVEPPFLVMQVVRHMRGLHWGGEREYILSFKGRASQAVNIGSGPECDLMLPDPSLSRQHARVSFNVADRRFTVEDMASSAGTYLMVAQGPPGTPLPVDRPATFKMGRTMLTVKVKRRRAGILPMWLKRGGAPAPSAASGSGAASPALLGMSGGASPAFGPAVAAVTPSPGGIADANGAPLRLPSSFDVHASSSNSGRQLAVGGGAAGTGSDSPSGGLMRAASPGVAPSITPASGGGLPVRQTLSHGSPVPSPRSSPGHVNGAAPRAIAINGAAHSNRSFRVDDAAVDAAGGAVAMRAASDSTESELSSGGGFGLGSGGTAVVAPHSVPLAALGHGHGSVGSAGGIAATGPAGASPPRTQSFNNNINNGNNNGGSSSDYGSNSGVSTPDRVGAGGGGDPAASLGRPPRSSSSRNMVVSGDGAGCGAASNLATPQRPPGRPHSRTEDFSPSNTLRTKSGADPAAHGGGGGTGHGHHSTADDRDASATAAAYLAAAEAALAQGRQFRPGAPLALPGSNDDDDDEDSPNAHGEDEDDS